MNINMADCDCADVANGNDIKHRPWEKSCSTFLKKYFPILVWLPKYSFYYFQCDFIAGVTVGLMVIPQCLAYASIARLSNDYGLYSSFMGCFIYCIFGTSKDLTIGPTAILSLMVATYNVPHCGDMANLMSFCIGIILLFMGIFRLGFIVRFISVPVISGFTSAAAITIACGQLKDFNGVEHSPRDFFPNLIFVFKRIEHWNYYDLIFGFACVVILSLMRLLSKLNWQNPQLSRIRQILYKILWLQGIAKNAWVVIMSCIISFALNGKYFTLIGDADYQLPDFDFPNFTVTCDDNITYGFRNALNQFSSGLAVIPLIAFVEAIAIGKAFSRVNNYKIQPTQELIALGVANIFGSFVSAYPVTGSFSRTAVNSQSGVRTPLAGVFTGAIVLLATKFLSSVFPYIPKACLGAVIVSAVLHMVDFQSVLSIWRVKKIDMVPFAATFFACFYTLEVGLIVGILISLIIVLYPIVNPTIEEEIKEITVIHVRSGLFYLGIEKVIERVENVLRQPNPPIAVILDMAGVTQIDFSVVIELSELSKQMSARLPGTELLVTNTCFAVKKVLIMAGLHDIITSPENISERYEESQKLLNCMTD